MLYHVTASLIIIMIFKVSLAVIVVTTDLAIIHTMMKSELFKVEDSIEALFSTIQLDKRTNTFHFKRKYCILKVIM